MKRNQMMHRNWILSTNDKWHILERDGRYACNKAVGIVRGRPARTDKFMTPEDRKHCCRNCLGRI